MTSQLPARSKRPTFGDGGEGKRRCGGLQRVLAGQGIPHPGRTQQGTIAGDPESH